MTQPRITIDFNQLNQVMQMGVRRASAFMKLGLSAAEDQTVTEIALPSTVNWHFFPTPTPVDVVRQMQFDFGHWIIGCALKELDQYCSVFCDQTYKALTLARSHGSPLSDVARKKAISFETETNVAKKLSMIAKEFGVEAEGSTYVPGFSKARNALTHNLGRVGERHLDRGRLEITWRAIDILFDGKPVADSDFNLPRPEETNVGLRVTERSKLFALNDFIEFTQIELSEICWNYSTIAQDIVRGAQATAAQMIRENELRPT